MTTELATIEPILPMDPQVAQQAMAAYQDLTRQVLTTEDWQGPPGRPGSFVKRRGWAKLATFYNVSTEIIRDHVERDDNGQPVRARAVARAVHQNGRHADGDGACSIDEARFSSPKARDQIAAGKVNVEHDLTATATTRAVNRAISNLIGFGAVSAEETDGSTPDAPWGPVATDEQMNLAAARLARIAPDIDPHKFILEMGSYFNGVPQACTKMISSLYDRVTQAQTPRGPNPTQVYPDTDAAYRYQGGD